MHEWMQEQIALQMRFLNEKVVAPTAYKFDLEVTQRFAGCFITEANMEETDGPIVVKMRFDTVEKTAKVV